MFKRAKHPFKFVRFAACLILLGACGESAESSESGPPVVTGGPEIRGVVVDGYIEGASVFLDLNRNHVRDVDEPTATTDARGAFVLRVSGMTAEQASSALFQAEIPDSAKDADDLGATLREAGKSGFTLLSPAAAFLSSVGGSAADAPAVISPLSTMVTAEMMAGDLPLAAAEAAVRARLGLEDKPLLRDFVAQPDAVLHNVARAAALSLAEAARSSGGLADGGAQMAPGQLVAAAVRSVREQLPAVVDELGLRRPDASIPSVAAVRSEWAKHRSGENEGDASVRPRSDVGMPESVPSGTPDAGDVVERPATPPRRERPTTENDGGTAEPPVAPPLSEKRDEEPRVDAGVGGEPRPASDGGAARPAADGGAAEPPAEVVEADAASPTTPVPSQHPARPTQADPSGQSASDATQPDVTPLSDEDEASSGKRRYVVVFRSHVGNPNEEATSAVRGRGGQITRSFSRAVKGFAVTLPDAAASAFLEAMERNPNVDHVEVDATVSAPEPTTAQTAATWGLDRIDQRDLPLSGTYAPPSAGTGVTAYIVDTGIRADHADFGGRVASGYTAIEDGYGTSDCHGHGTHVAGTVGGATWGVAKNVTLVPVRVLSCTGSGTLSGVIAGLDWVIANVRKPAVVNMSLGAGASAAIDTAVANAVASGITVVVAGGNSGADACDYSPARAPSAITVGATTSSDARASYSNYGSCLDLFAPGSSIKSSWYSGTTETATLSGTSMAAPHVAGMAALILQNAPIATPAQVDEWIKGAATLEKVTSAGAASPNRLLYIYLGESNDQPPVNEPAPEPEQKVVSVSSLLGAASSARGTWRATITTGVKNAQGTPVAGVLVSGAFTAGGLSVQCTTAADGACSLTSGHLSQRITETNFTVGALSGTNLQYDPAQNVLSQVLVRKP